MIKAEVISHEGNPGPNWLDRCRTAVTPTNITVLVLFIAAGAIFIGITRNDKAETANQQPAGNRSQQSDVPASRSLQVQPLSEKTTTTNGNTSVQSAAGGSDQATTPATDDKSADSLGATPTPALNSTGKPGSTQPQAPVNLNQINNQLQSSLQRTRDSVNQTVNKVNQTVDGVTSGLLGL